MLFFPRCRALLSVVFDGRGAANSPPLTVEAAPMSASVERNGYHDADTWSLEFDARAMPFDPELIASCAVRIYMYDSGGDDAGEWAIEGNEMVRGLADDADLRLEDGQTFSMSGRDCTAALDGEWDPRKKVPAGKPLDVTIQLIADAAAPPGTLARFAVEWRASFLPPRCGGLARSTKKKGLWVKPGKTHWQVIYDLAVGHGAFAFVRGSTIVVTDARAQTEATLREAPRLVYGRNLMSLEAKRKLAKERVPQVQVTGYDPRTKQRVEVLWPPKGSKITTGLGTKKDEILRLPGPAGVIDRDTLLRHAKNRAELLGRAEATYSFETRNLAVGRNDGIPGTDRRDVDLLRLQAGSPIALAFDAFNAEEMRQLDSGARQEHLVARGYSASVAAFVARHYERLAQFQQPYYLRSIQYDWSSSDGITISGEAVNYASEQREKGFAA